MKYLKKFETHAEYEAAESGLILPNVSLCVQENEVHYNPYVIIETRLVAKFNVTSTTTTTKIGYNQYISGFTEIEIDGVKQDNVVSAYTFTTTGEHTVKYTLKNEATIGSRAFSGCTSLTSIDIPRSVTMIEYGTFGDCTSLTSIDIPSSVTRIDNGAFDGCTSLTSIDIPSGVTSISTNPWKGCSSLSSITVDSNNSIYDSRNNCNAIIESSTNVLIVGCKNTVIPSGVTSIDMYAFCSGSSLTSITIPSGVTSIGISAFGNCTSLTSCTFAQGSQLTVIGQMAFLRCSSLTSIDIPSGVTSIGGSAFQYCSSLTSITSNATTAPSITYTTFYEVKTNGTLYVPIGSKYYNTWMQNTDNYLGKYNWTKVEQ